MTTPSVSPGLEGPGARAADGAGGSLAGGAGPSVAAGAGRSPASRSRRDVLRTAGLAALVGIAGLLGRPLPARGQEGRKKRRAEERRSREREREASAPPSMTVETSRSPALEVANTSRNGEAVGIHGTSASPDGTAGLFIASGGGTAVEARSGQKGGTALRTRGRIDFMERSGIASASGGAEFVIPVAGGLGRDSIVLATLQDHHVGVHVESASVLDADEGLIVVRLNQALAEPGRIGWIVLG